MVVISSGYPPFFTKQIPYSVSAEVGSVLVQVSSSFDSHFLFDSVMFVAISN